MKLVQLFCIICSLFLFTNNTFAKDTEKNYAEIPMEYFQGDVSIHMCPIEKWDTYSIKTARNDYDIANIYVNLQSNGKKRTLFVTWPTEENLEVICNKNNMIIVTNLNSNMVIISNYLLIADDYELK